MLAQYRSQCRLGQLAGSGTIIFNPDDGFFRIHHPEVQHRIYPHGNVVFGDHVLAGDIQSDHPKVNSHNLLDTGNDDDQSRAFHALEPTQKKDHATLVFRQDLDC